MPIIKSAKKRVKVSAKATVRNAKTRRTLREAVKAFYAALATGKADKISETLSKANSAIDIATKKNVIHKNKAARKKSQLSSAAKTAGAKTKAVKKPVAKKAAATKPAAKKPAKKPAVKKAPVKKTTKK
jgi:small subunit ribosomal protein S20